jgi:chemotaxis protein methyltransferase WspC
VKFGPVRARLAQDFGLSADALSPSVLGPAVERRMRARALEDLPAYLALLDRSPEEALALAEEVIVPETWFFRGEPVFRFLAEHAAQVVRARPGGAPFRALSVPCSSGEEPCSLALALFEAQVPRSAWSVDAVDLSERLLDRARRGEYSELSFRQTPLELRQRYFRPAGARWALEPAVREAVRYRQGNLLAADFLAGEAPFDLVLCRNLLIYLRPEARARALATLDRLVAADGLLGLGHADPLGPGAAQFARFGPHGLFLYHRAPAAAGPARVEEKPLAPRWAGPAKPQAMPAAGPRLRLSGRAPEAVAAPPPPPPESPLDRARRLADAGALTEALAECQAELARGAPSAELFSLLGLVHQARQERAEAERCYLKALYLQPDHRDALLHLMLLYREDGDQARAELLRRRLARVDGGEK